MSVFFSIVIPAYNAAGFIGKALDSVRDQSCTDYEVLVVNDGSSDATGSVLRAYGENHPGFPLTVISQPNKGIGGARNAGVFAASGEFIAFLDSDDSWNPEKLATVSRFLQAHPVVDVACHYEAVVNATGVLKLLKYGPIDNRDAYQDLLFNGNRLSPSATVVRRELAQATGGFSEEPRFNSAEDYEFWLRLASNGAHFALIPEVLGSYWLEENSITSKIAYHHGNIQHVLDHHFGILRSRRADHALIDRNHRIRTAATVFAAGRSYYLAGIFPDSMAAYLKAVRMHPFRWKPYAGLLQASLMRIIKHGPGTTEGR
jgi:teichuronic acid biosynthesis glycosyltransferase TuaG